MSQSTTRKKASPKKAAGTKREAGQKTSDSKEPAEEGSDGRIRGVSPVGAAVFPKLAKPDTKFNNDGVYSVHLALEGDEAEAFAGVIHEQMDKSLEEAREKLEKERDEATGAKKTKLGKALEKLEQADPPFSPEYDRKTGEETGRTLFNFRAKASGQRNDGERWERGPIPTFDAKKNRMDDPGQVGFGSIIKVSYLLDRFFTPQVGAGVTLRLAAVQVLELKSFGKRTADDYGFGEEEGYKSEAGNEDDPFAEETGGGSDDLSDEDIPF